MNNRTTLEVIAPSIEEAIEKGLNELGLREEDVEVEVLDTGSRGLFGLGSRQARVRLTLRGAGPAPAETKNSQPEADTDLDLEEEEQPEPQPAAEAEDFDEQERITELARQTVGELLFKMSVQADVIAYFGKPDDSRSRAPLCVDIRGKDLSILIGRQAETLNALQYITNLILSKELGFSVPLVLDVEGYRKRREQQLRQLARRMADQALKTGRRQVLEPMPANERRIVHLELRSNNQVETESVGEDPRRKVTIFPK